MPDSDNILSIAKLLGDQAKKKVKEALGTEEEDKKQGPTPWPPMRNEDMSYMEPDWDELDRKANAIVITYTTVSAVATVLPLIDVAVVTATFSKMATELAGVYQVLVSAKRARQMGWAIASTTGAVLGATYGAAYAASKIAKFIPGAGYLVSVAIQAPLTAAVAWAAGDSLKNYFKACRQGRDPGIEALKESFTNTLHIKLKTVKLPGGKNAAATEAAAQAAATSAASAATATESSKDSVSDAVEKLATMHELLKQGAISQAEYDKKKAELLSRI
ncbi:DUF697 domain-containing protein [Armatimonas sp.]|uniref:DUF697 domain-containing protein n=1 Tax=Armatimonas sp. TaxID=1872638 RepID=UPI00286ABEAB|nr:DUF697 domain-containing protein [Armatimonas sp.]